MEEVAYRVCKGCGKKKAAEDYYKDRWKKQKKTLVWYRSARCKECCKAEKKRDYHARKEHYTNANLRKYGITLAKYQQMLKEQQGKCKICGTNDPKGRGKFHVDHCHETRFVRGLLCHHCNLLLGLAKDNEGVLNAAIRYLDNFYRNELY